MKSIKSRLVLIFTGVILILNVGLSLMSISIVSKNLIKDTHSDLMEIAKEEAKYIAARRDAELRYVDALAQNTMIMDETIPLEQKITFFEAEAKRTGYLAFAFADKNGDSTVFNSKKEKTNIAQREYFQTAMTGKPAASDLLISSATGELVMIYAVPISKNGQQMGVLYGRKDGTALNEMVSQAKHKQTGHGYMINNQGVTVADDIELVLRQENVIEDAKKDKSLQSLADLTQNHMIKREVGYGDYEYEGVHLVAGFAPVEGSPWIIVMEIEQQEILGEVNALRNLLIVLCLAAIAIGAITTFFVSGTIVKPIKKVTVAAKQIADGNFNVHLSVNSHDEMGQLSKAFNATIIRLVEYQGYIDEISDALMQISQGNLIIELERDYTGQFKKLEDNLQALIDNLNFTLLNINQSADQVASGSEQVASSSQELAQGATEQASSVEELSASISEIATQVKQNAQNAKSASDMAGLAGNEIRSSNEQMKSMIIAMEQITLKSSEISKIIKVIDDIAFQTNILALNAAVEAARAGVAGKGFAVVASEVRNLAGKSAEAAKSTTTLIEETLAAVGNGSSIVNKTASALKSSAKTTNEAVTLINKIATASNDQATSIAQVNQGVDQVSAVVQTNAATAEESAAASEELSSQSSLLKETISKFKLKETHN